MRWLAILVLLGGVIAAPRVDAQRADKATTLLESAKQAELVDGNLDAAIKLYLQIITTYPADRPAAAAALLGLGHCYEKLGLPKARATYQRLVEQYTDQTREVNEARARLAQLTEDTSARGEGGEVVLREVWSRSSGSITNGVGTNSMVIFSDLSVHSPETGQTKRLTDGARSAAYPVLSPNRQQVAYLSWSGDLQASLQQAQNNRAGLPARTELRIVGIDGKNDRAILSRRDVTWLRPLAWSQDGYQILADFERKDGSHDLTTVAVEDGKTRVLKSLDQRSPEDAGFSPDGQYVAYHLPSARDARQLDLFVVPVNTAGKTPTERRYSMTLGSELATLTPDRQLVIHVLNRLTFGPRPGDIDKVSTLGVDAFINRQLNPERIPDPFVDAGLKKFTSLQMDLTESLLKGAPVAPQAMRERVSIFEKRALADRLEQKAAYSAEDNTIMPTTFEARKALLKGHPEPSELASARLLRAIYSERQLFELVVDFWMNHFSIKLGDHQQAPHFEEQVIRRLALGKFEDLLIAVAKHPRMLNYLDNWRSSAPEEVVAARIAALKPTLNDQQYLALMARKPFLDQAKGLNENYARELMELHTLGVDGGYTQKDVVEVAKVLTGWTISKEGIYQGREADDGVFAFDPLLHVDGKKVVLGKTIEDAGVSEGEQVLRLLAHHPSTARFIATKLARRFVSDEPPVAVIDAAAKTFQQTGGDIREVLRTIFMSPQFRSPEAFRSKIKKPFEIVVSSLRAVKAETEGFISDPELSSLLLNGQRGILQAMGERLYNYEAPDGNPDVSAAWMNSNALLVRLDFANRLAIGSLPRIKPNLAEGQKLLDQLGLARPTPQQIATTRTMLQAARTAAQGNQMDMMTMGRGGSRDDTSNDIDPAAIVVAAMLGSPQFQKR
jgi:uncharacterized protein (DUF1800 family)